jgi:hypothetical protein
MLRLLCWDYSLNVKDKTILGGEKVLEGFTVPSS